jgi:sulfopyruvate decarboxylase TPP-binding subunit
MIYLIGIFGAVGFLFLASYYSYAYGVAKEKIKHQEFLGKLQEEHIQKVDLWVKENERITEENKKLRQEVHEAFKRGASVAEIISLLTRASESESPIH